MNADTEHTQADSVVACKQQANSPPSEAENPIEEKAALTMSGVEMPPLALPRPQSVEIHHALDKTPIFSRHNVTEKVVFPVRKPLSPPLSQRQNMASPHTTSFLERMSSTWVWARDQLQLGDVSLTLRSTFSETSNSTPSNEEEDSRVSDRDPYDSWPYIRTAIEQDVKEEDQAEVEEESFFKWALGFASPRPSS